MEILGLIDLPVWLLCLLTPVVSIVVYTWRVRRVFVRIGVKTKPSLFFFGDMFQLAKKGFCFYDLPMIRKYGRVFGTFVGNKPVLVVTDTEMIKQITVKEFPKFQERGVVDFASKTKNLTSSLSLAEGTLWRFLRSSLTPCFTAVKLRKMHTRISSCNEKFHRNLQERIVASPDGLDFIPIYQAYTLDVICSTGFGMDVDSIRDPENAFVKNAKLAFSNAVVALPVTLLNIVLPDLPGLSLLSVEFVPDDAVKFFRTVIKQLIEERKDSTLEFPDLLHTMLNAHKEGIDTSSEQRAWQSIEDMKREGLSDEELVINSLGFMLAAFETTSVTLSWLTYDLVINPECQEKLIKEIDREIGEETPTYDNVLKLSYLDMVVKETTRYRPPLQLIGRRALEDITICGVAIPKGMSILIPAFALHFMTEYWENPTEYNPERFAPENKPNLDEYAYLPFGIGPRSCIGMRLALLEIKMIIVSILQKYRILKADKLEIPMPADGTGLSYKPTKPVLVKLAARK